MSLSNALKMINLFYFCERKIGDSCNGITTETA